MPIKFIEEEDQAPTVGEKAKAFSYGAATGFVGGPGELEKFGAYDVPELVGARQKGERDTLGGRETIFPTIEEAQRGLKKVGIEKPREEVSGYQTAGEIIGGFGTALPGMARGAVRGVLGTTTRAGEAVARRAEKLGFKLSPSQTRELTPLSSRGATGFEEANQKLANELASAGTGQKSARVNPEFIRKRLDDLGGQYDKLYKGKQFAVDPSVTNALQNILTREQELGVAGVSTVKQAAQTMLDTIQSKGLVVIGDDLQRLRNALTQRARETGSRQNAHEIYGLVDVIDAAVANQNPAYKATLDILRPQYRNSIILEDLYRQGGIKQGNISLERLGNMLRSDRQTVRRSGQDIDQLGMLGRELGLRARWEDVGRAGGAAQTALGKMLGMGVDLTSKLTGQESRLARELQKRMRGDKSSSLGGLPEAVAAGTAVRPLQSE